MSSINNMKQAKASSSSSAAQDDQPSTPARVVHDVQAVSWYLQLSSVLYKNLLLLSRRPLQVILMLLSSIGSVLLASLTADTNNNATDKYLDFGNVTLTSCGTIDGEYLSSLAENDPDGATVPLSYNEGWRNGFAVTIMGKYKFFTVYEYRGLNTQTGYNIIHELDSFLSSLLHIACSLWTIDSCHCCLFDRPDRDSDTNVGHSSRRRSTRKCLLDVLVDPLFVDGILQFILWDNHGVTLVNSCLATYLLFGYLCILLFSQSCSHGSFLLFGIALWYRTRRCSHMVYHSAHCSSMGATTGTNGTIPCGPYSIRFGI